MNIYSAVTGQSLYDVCLNTYGTLDLLLKLIMDNNIENINVYPYSGQSFSYDPSLIVNQTTSTIAQLSGIKYATGFTNNGRDYYIVNGGINNGTVVTYPQTGSSMVKYQNVKEAQYIAAGGETSINLSSQIQSGASIIQITKEIKPLKTTEFGWNTSSSILTLTQALMPNQTLFIIYGIIVTS